MSVLRTSLTGQQREVEERLRTVCLLLCGLAVVAAGLYYLKAILIPLVLAVSLMYILQPLIDFLTRRPLLCCGRRCCVQRPNLDGVPACLRPVAESCLLVRLPYWLAVCVALVVACAVIAFFGFVVADSVRTFSSKATEYTARVQLLARTLVSWLDDMQISWQHYMTSPRGSLAHANATAAAPLIDPARIEELAKKVPVGDMILSRRNSAFGVSTSAHGDAAIRSYLKSKIGVSILVGLATAVSLAALGVDLWLVFGLLGFWLNFVPTVGTLVAVLLPMPVVLLDERFGPVQVVLALALPLAAHGFAGNVLEPMLFGSTLRLHPVVVLLSLMTWAALWGVTGMVLAVPITAAAHPSAAGAEDQRTPLASAPPYQSLDLWASENV
ncbi:hypothetical protein EMIHUDRAFT_456279 [Emiliania huxleyi CCMP1516]|uniref:AI-2E family transporter n=2 Tax=Emiliania huxleyi TaxID=2903 RepID=A0A0D3K717_EMIH1|nr:hypothetical protein EMIHUDRAFT_456279 [Emiliania huxleyi CCMP1516]EOD31552.1 hypothetical protein EMIHUDRAFT_456279 [Emiliania huxleyi CCMP1516]|eukprot:XP_005783981.1 hypothetical protein EMIHUDRAFT_456279 [Emiliania huxleyi CCMP1516]